MRRTLFVLHVLTSAVFLGAVTALLALVVAADPATDPGGFAALMPAQPALVDWLLLPGLALSVVTGLAVLLYKVELLERRWLLIKLCLTVLAAGIALGNLMSAAYRLPGTVGAAAATLAEGAAALAAAVLLLLVAIYVLSIIRPRLGGR